MTRDKAILLVEDNANDQELTRLAFETNHISNPMVIANDGAEALEYLFCTGPHADRDINDVPELIILDLKLPKIDGLEVLQRIRGDDRTRYLPVVVLTSSKEQQDLINAYQLGTNAYVPKPVDFNQFIEAVKQLGLFWLILNKCPYDL
jgi:two-component system, response regulator